MTWVQWGRACLSQWALHFLQSRLGTETCCHWLPQSWHSPRGLLVRLNAISRRKPLKLYRFLKAERKGSYREEDEHFREQMSVRPTRKQKSKGVEAACICSPGSLGDWQRNHCVGCTCGSLPVWDLAVPIGQGQGSPENTNSQAGGPLAVLCPSWPLSLTSPTPTPHRRALPSNRGSAPSGFRNLKLTVPAQSPWRTFAERNLLHGEISDQALAGLLATTEGYES